MPSAEEELLASAFESRPSGLKPLPVEVESSTFFGVLFSPDFLSS
jgi:hypothetical protein